MNHCLQFKSIKRSRKLKKQRKPLKIDGVVQKIKLVQISKAIIVTVQSIQKIRQRS